MSEVANIGENQPNAVQKATAAETTSSELPAAAESVPAPTTTPTEAELVTEKQVGNNADGAAAGDAGTSAAEAAKPAESSPKVENKKTPAKRTPSKRMSFIERAQKESEELVKNMGGSLELEGGRRTRSSARGTPTRAAVVSTPPPAKKARTSPANAGTTPSRGRGRGRKIDIAESAEEKAKKEASEKSDEKSEAATSEITDKDKSTAEKAEDAPVEPQADTDIADVAPSVEANKKPQDQEEKKTEKDAVTEKSEDKPDAATLESVPEEKQNNVDHAVERKHPKAEAVLAAEPPKVDSPMETDEQPDENVPVATTSAESAPAVIDVKAIETPAAAEVISKATDSVAVEAPASASTTAPAAAKEPTPEPMEVDSSSKSNDAVELIETAALQPEVLGETNSTPAASVEQEKPIEAQNIVQNNSGESAVENAKQNEVNATSAVAAVIGETTSVNATTLETGASALEGCTKIAPTAISAPAATDVSSENNKGQNDFCEPKITSPSINASSNDGAVTTPQFCN